MNPEVSTEGRKFTRRKILQAGGALAGAAIFGRSPEAQANPQVESPDLLVNPYRETYLEMAQEFTPYESEMFDYSIKYPAELTANSGLVENTPADIWVSAEGDVVLWGSRKQLVTPTTRDEYREEIRKNLQREQDMANKNLGDPVTLYDEEIAPNILGWRGETNVHPIEGKSDGGYIKIALGTIDEQNGAWDFYGKIPVGDLKNYNKFRAMVYSFSAPNHTFTSITSNI